MSNILKALAVTAELTGTELSKAGVLAFEAELMRYPEATVLKALERFRRESKGRMTLPGVLDLIEDEDGRPSSDEAWAMCPHSEEESTFWTNEAREAFGIARRVLESGDKIGARMAFREAYDRLVREARAEGRRPEWSVSLGWDAQARERAVMKAVERGLIAPDAAQHLLPAPKSDIERVLLEGKSVAALPNLTNDDREQFKRGIAMVKATLEKLNGGA